MEEKVKVKEPSLGEVRVGVNFNPTEHPVVKSTKRTYANEIDRLETMRTDITTEEPVSRERQRTISRAQTHAEDACMLAVKCIFQ